MTAPGALPGADPPADGGLWARLVWTKDVMRGVPVIAGLIALVCLLLAKPQGSDLVLSITEAPRGVWGGALITALSSLFLGGQAWFWSRRLIDRNTDCALRYADHPLLLVTPQVLGLAPPLMTAVVVVLAEGPPAAAAALVAAVVLSVAGMVGVRRWLMSGETAAAKSAASPPGTPSRVNARLDAFADTFAAVSMGLALVAMIAMIAGPVWLPQHLGSVAMVYLGVGLIIPILAAMLLATRRSRFPVTEAVLVWAAVLSAVPFDNHESGRRALGGQRLGGTGASPLTLAQVFDAWYAQAPGEGTERDPKPLVVVAVEGGASRAGYWTARVLGRLEADSRGAFSRSVLALSSVSGGSVGAVAFVSQLHDQRTPRAEIQTALSDVAGADFLSPALGGLLFPDLLQRVLPIVPLPRGGVIALPDRAEPLERAFEASWRAHCRARGADCTRPDLWAEPLQAVAPDVAPGASRWTPALFVNGAREEDGRRVLTSTVAIDPQVFPDALDFRLASRGDPAISTAILNGARFPIVSPGGTLTTPDGQPRGHVLDGGYFEGSGVTTARDILRAAVAFARAKAAGARAGGGYVRPILIEINNDSDSDPDDVRLVRDDPQATSPRVDPRKFAPLQPPLKTRYFMSDLLGPLLGVSQSRDGRAAAAAGMLSQEFAKAHGPGFGPWGVRPAYRLVHLCKRGDRGMPMDWAVSAEARDIAGWALSNCKNRDALADIVADITRPSPVQGGLSR